MRRSPDTYDAIVSEHTISNSAIASGALALTENYVLTKEAFEDYYAHLSADGVIFFTRPQDQIPRLLATGREVLEAHGAKDPGAHLYAFGGRPGKDAATTRQNRFSAGMLLKKTPFTANEIYRMDAFLGVAKPDGDVAAALKVADDYVARGSKALKLRLSGAPMDAAVLRAVRDAFPRIGLMADLNEKGDALSAARTAALCADHGVLWLEEPLPSADLSGLARLAGQRSVPIATGEHLQGLEQFTGMMSAGQIAVAQPDLAMIGGITPSFMLAQTAEAFGVVVAPHFLPNLFAHVAAAAPNLTWLEDFPLLEPLFDDPAGFDARGELSPSSIPGHGLEITPETRARFLKTSWTSA